MDHMEEMTIDEDYEENGSLPERDEFYTLTMAEILEQQGLKTDALKVYQALLKKAVKSNLSIRCRIEKILESNYRTNVYVEKSEVRKRYFANWVHKLRKERG